MKYLGIDLGTKTVGIAVSDKTGLIASSYINLKFTNNEKLIKDIIEIITKENIEQLVLGFPKNMNNSIGERAQQVLEFQKLLQQKTNIKISLQDERLSTKEGTDILIKNNVSRAKRKKLIDKMAASIILQAYLDKERNK